MLCQLGHCVGCSQLLTAKWQVDAWPHWISITVTRQSIKLVVEYCLVHGYIRLWKFYPVYVGPCTSIMSLLLPVASQILNMWLSGHVRPFASCVDSGPVVQQVLWSPSTVCLSVCNFIFIFGLARPNGNYVISHFFLAGAYLYVALHSISDAINVICYLLLASIYICYILFSIVFIQFFSSVLILVKYFITNCNARSILGPTSDASGNKNQ